MPREQIQKLNTRKATEVAQGTIGTGITEVVNKPIVAPDTSGQKLAEAFGVATKALGSIVKIQNDETQKTKAIWDRAEGNLAGRAKAQELQLEAEKLPFEERQKFLQDGMMNWVESYRGATTTDAFFSGAMGGFTTVINPYENSLIKETETRRLQSLSTTAQALVETDFENGESPYKMIENIGTITQGNRADTAKTYISSVGHLIRMKAKQDPNYDWKAAIGKNLRIVSKDGQVDYGKDSVYGGMIEKIEDQILADRKEAYLENKRLDEINVTDTQKGVANKLISGGSKDEAMTYLTQNSKGFTIGELNKTKDAIASWSTTMYAKTSNPDIYNSISNSIYDGNFDPNTLVVNKSNLTETDIKILNDKHIKYQEAMKTEKVKVANDTFNRAVSAGKDVAAGKKTAFTSVFGKDDAKKIQIFTDMMVQKRFDFISTNGIEELTPAIVRQWAKESQEEVEKQYPPAGTSTMKSVPVTGQGSNNVSSSTWNNPAPAQTNTGNGFADWLRGIFN